ncbi:S8 family peptidase [Gimesia fumaroli]|uniref:Subtilase family protein n=1 Tax=Gimesia fumaroli TaxID=2527976 RepID=A0A518IAF2_9PLAN|nr:S8 family peptidase [Gimesia fumaroli]QDV50093.1 Subtilase family protein [Gimesia fumaroli]
MDNEFPPRELVGPTIQKRKKEKSRAVPLSKELLARKNEIARVLGTKVDQLDKQLRSLTDEQRRTIFYKITHDGPVKISGIGLKPLTDRSESITLAVPTGSDLHSFKEKIQAFAADIPKKDRVKHPELARIEDVERGDPKDRLSDELFAKYDDLVKKQYVICEIEILSLLNGRNKQREEIRQILADLRSVFANGIHGTLFEHEEREGVCRAVIRCTGEMFRRLVEEDRWQRRISWFEPKPKFETFQTVRKNFKIQDLETISAPNDQVPIICIVDSGVSSGNPFLEPVTKDEMLKSFLKHSPDNPYDENGHGSGVASLAAYYALDLNKGARNSGKAWIASARILDASNQLEEERLFSKVIEEVVKEFVPLGVRIFNLSVADLAKKWNPDNKRTQPRTSWTARTLDRLSREFDIVFVVSTGNIPLNQIREYINSEVEYPSYLCDSDSRILDPGQAGLALSVGSIAPSTLISQTADTAIALAFEPSPFTRSGPGIKEETKPDLVEFGGNLLRSADPLWVQSNLATNVVMASHQLSPAIAYDYGTSFAAPRVANKLAIVLNDLTDMGPANVSAPLLKAFLINSAGYRGDLNHLQEHLDRKRWLDVLGNGWPDAARATECDDYSVILFHQGRLGADQVAFFEIPVPAQMIDSTAKKRITVTVVHDPEVQKWGLENYFGISLKWRMFRGDVDQEKIIDGMSTAEEGNDESETVDIPNELKYEHKVNRRSRGTVQHDWCEWTQHREEFSNNHYTLAIASYKKWQRKVEPTKIGVVVRIEDLGGTVMVYNEVRTQLDILIEQRAKV